jgi:hypothetical protein
MVMKISSRGRKTICLPIDSPEQYQIIVEDLEEFRPYLDEVIKSCPELLPPEIMLASPRSPKTVKSKSTSRIA